MSDLNEQHDMVRGALKLLEQFADVKQFSIWKDDEEFPKVIVEAYDEDLGTPTHRCEIDMELLEAGVDADGEVISILEVQT